MYNRLTIIGRRMFLYIGLSVKVYKKSQVCCNLVERITFKVVCNIDIQVAVAKNLKVFSFE